MGEPYKIPNRMTAYTMSAKPDHISYGTMEFKSFHVHEVYIDGKQKGEYHIKPCSGKDPVSAVLFLKNYFPGCSIGLADPSGLLNLEYPIYLICKSDPLIMESISQIFEKVDEDVSEHRGVVKE